MVKVSVIVAARNAEHTICGCVNSLLRTDYARDQRELIVVDNGSRDATYELLAGYGSEVTLIREGRLGPSAARNAGLRAASGDVVAFTDADCIVDPDWLAHIVDPLRDPMVGVVGGRILPYQRHNSIAQFGARVHDHRRAVEQCVPPYAITMNWASRRGVLEEAGLFDPGLLRCSDVDMAFRLLQAGYRLVYEPEAVVHHWNRDTVPSLLRQGYVHGYFGGLVRRRHAAFIRQAHAAQSERVSSRPAPRLLVREVVPDGPAHFVWALLFEAAKGIGRLQAAVAGRGADT